MFQCFKWWIIITTLFKYRIQLFILKKIIIMHYFDKWYFLHKNLYYFVIKFQLSILGYLNFICEQSILVLQNLYYYLSSKFVPRQFLSPLVKNCIFYSSNLNTHSTNNTIITLFFESGSNSYAFFFSYY